MPDPNENQGDNLIRITMEDATSAHVEDLLRRQMSLRGEQGVARDQRKWYYQNWIIFMIAGALAALAAWAIIEPRFEDYPYVQGQITDIHADAEMPDYMPGDRDEKGVQWQVGGHGRIQIGDDNIWIADDAREWGPKGAGGIVSVESLKVGQEIGVYAEYHAAGGNAMSLARFIVLSPKPWPSGEQHLDIPRLKSRTNAMGLLLFPTVAGMIGLALGAVDGAVCRHLRRALLSGLIGLFVGLVGGFIGGILGDLVYGPLNHLALAQIGSGGGFTPFAFLLQMIGRSFGWALAGMAMGLGQGIALRSVRLLLYGLVGGLVGGLFGGLFFDPIDILMLGPDKPSAWVSRLVGMMVVGGSVGAAIGLVELLARDAWLRMVEGPLAGKEFLLFKDIMNVGASPRSDIYLFNDPQVAQQHATLRLVGDDCEIEAKSQQTLVMLNNRIVSSSRLHHGDRIAIGRTVFVFQTRKT